MTKEDLRKVYISRPFKIRNADEYDLENILDLFIDPTEGLIGPFDFSNSIIKGKMGSGKTMYLRANYAYYLYTTVPSLIEHESIVLPVYIKLSDFQNIENAEQIYCSIILKIIEEIVGIYKHLQSSDELTRLHTGACTPSGLWATDNTFSKITENLKKLSSLEYVKKVTDSFKVKGSASARFLSACTEYEKNEMEEIKLNTTPTFQDVILANEYHDYNLVVAKVNGMPYELRTIDKMFYKLIEEKSLHPVVFHSLRHSSTSLKTKAQQR